MKKSIFYSVVAVILVNLAFIAGCKKKPTYSCISGKCEEVKKGDYESLADCQKQCGSAGTSGTTGSSGSTGTSGATCPAGYDQSISGSLEINAKLNPDYGTCKDAYIIRIDIARTADDLSKGNFVASKTPSPATASQTISGLCGGKYYYKVTRTFNAQKCQISNGPTDYNKTALFEIKSATPVKVEVNMQ